MIVLASQSPFVRPAAGADPSPSSQALLARLGEAAPGTSLPELQAQLEGSLKELTSSAKALSIGGIIIEQIFGGVAGVRASSPAQRAAFSALKQALEHRELIRDATVDRYLDVSIQQQELPAGDDRGLLLVSLPLSQQLLLMDVDDVDVKLQLAQEAAERSLTSEQLEGRIATALGRPIAAGSPPEPSGLLSRMRRLARRLPAVIGGAQKDAVPSPGKLAATAHVLHEQVDELARSVKASLEAAAQASGQPLAFDDGWQHNVSRSELLPPDLEPGLASIAGWIEARVRETTGLQKAITVGGFLIDHLYGSVAEAQSRSPRKSVSLRKIAEYLKDHGLCSIVSLSNYIRVAIQQRELPDDPRYQVFDKLTLSQRLLLTRIEDPTTRLHLAERAAQDMLTCKQLAVLVAEALGDPAPTDPALESLLDQMRRLTAELLQDAPLEGPLGAVYQTTVRLKQRLHKLARSLSPRGRTWTYEEAAAAQTADFTQAINCKDEVQQRPPAAEPPHHKGSPSQLAKRRNDHSGGASPVEIDLPDAVSSPCPPPDASHAGAGGPADH